MFPSPHLTCYIHTRRKNHTVRNAKQRISPSSLTVGTLRLASFAYLAILVLDSSTTQEIAPMLGAWHHDMISQIPSTPVPVLVVPAQRC